MSALDEASGPRFAGAERRSFVVPITLAVLVLSAGLLGWTRLFPGGAVTLEPVRMELVPTHTVFASDTIVVGAVQAQDDLYVAATVRLRNTLRVPVTIDDLTCTLTDAQGAEMTVSGIGGADLRSVETTFPLIKPVMGTPLMRESAVAAGQAAEGTVLCHFPLTEAVWAGRKAADVAVALYHRDPVTATLPKEPGK